MIQLVELAVACPVKRDNPDDCPLHELRMLPMAGRFEWAKTRTREEAKAILAAHASCPHRDCAAN